MKPEEGKVLKIKLKTSITVLGKVRGTEYFEFKPIYSQSCNCITSYEIKSLDSDDISSWEYPENQRELNTIYEEYLTENQ